MATGHWDAPAVIGHPQPANSFEAYASLTIARGFLIRFRAAFLFETEMKKFQQSY
jgi:hypothetical protein